MKEIITITTLSRSTVTIFTKSITYIEHTNTGCVIHLDQNVNIRTQLNWKELCNILEINFVPTYI